MVKQLKSEPVDHLFEAILTLKSKEECYSFFEDLCTCLLYTSILIDAGQLSDYVNYEDLVTTKFAEEAKK